MKPLYTLALVVLPGCSFIGATGEVGFIQLAFTGDAALASAKGGVPPGSFQDVSGGLGLGSDMGSPYLRGQIDLGSAVITASGVIVEEEGSGTLARTFGPIAAGTMVRSELDIANIKLGTTFDIGFGPVKISPGIGLDLIDFSLTATESTFGNQGEIDQLLPLPMLFIRAEGDIGIIGEIGYLDMPEIDGAEIRLLDFAAMLEFRFFPALHLFAGYRLIDIDGLGEAADSSFALDVFVDGWMIGGGMRL